MSFVFSLSFIQLASLRPSNPSSERDPVLRARPTVAPVHGEPTSVPARAVSIAPTLTLPSPPAPVSHPPRLRRKGRKSDIPRCVVSEKGLDDMQ